VRVRRLTLPTALAALTLGLATVATPAIADPGGTTIDPVTEPVAFTSASSGQLPLGYTCAVLASGDSTLPLDVALTQSSSTATATGSVSATCDGAHHTADVPLTGAGIVSGDTYLVAHLGDQTSSEIITVDVAPAPAIYLDGDVRFSDATHGVVTLDYSCRGDAGTLDVAIAGSSGRTASGLVQVRCDGLRETVDVPLTATAPGFDTAGTYAVQLQASIGQQASLVTTANLQSQGTPVPPAPVKATVELTTNASPERVIKGKKITISGTVRRAGKKVALKTTLQFRSDDAADYARVKSVTSSKKGALKTTVKASGSGSFRYVYAGSSTTEPATSAGDHIVVKPKPTPKPKPKAYKNCTELRKVYPHGVGKSGAQDKGGDVTDFTRDTKTYNKNKKSDRDKDDIACEA